jgi:hypothetical protein
VELYGILTVVKADGTSHPALPAEVRANVIELTGLERRLICTEEVDAKGHRLLFNHPAIQSTLKHFFIDEPPHFAIRYPERFRFGYGKFATAAVSLLVCVTVYHIH